MTASSKIKDVYTLQLSNSIWKGKSHPYDSENVQGCLQQWCLQQQQTENLLNSHQQENVYIVEFLTMGYTIQQVK